MQKEKFKVKLLRNMLRNKNFKKNISVVIFLLGFFAVQKVQAAMNVWVDTGMSKARQQGDYTGTGQQAQQDINLKSAKNEFESFQIFINANGEDLTNVDVSVSDLSDGNGHTITSNVTPGVNSDITIYKEGYDYIADTLSSSDPYRKTRTDYTGGYVPNVLFPKKDKYYNELRSTFPFSVTSENVQGVWVDIGTTTATIPGTYFGTYTVSAEGKTSVTGNISLQVWDFTLPSTASQKNLFVIGDSQLEHGYFGTWYTKPLSWVAQEEALFVKAMLYARISPSIKGGGNYFTTVVPDGSVTFTSNFNTAYKAGLDGTSITNGTYASAKVPAIDMEGAAATSTYVRSSNIQSATSNKVVLDTMASGTDSFYNQMYIVVGSQTKKITSYNGTSKEATLDTNWNPDPSPNASYTITNPTSDRDSDAVQHTNFLQSWWDYFTANNWDPMQRLYAYLIDEPHGYKLFYRGETPSDYKVVALKSQDMYNVNTGGQGHWRNSFTTKNRDTTDSLLNSDLINPSPPILSLDITGFWCPVIMHYEYFLPNQLMTYKNARDSYSGYNDWPKENHWTYISNMNYYVPPGSLGQVDISTDSSAYWTRALGWVNWTYRTTGMLYYDINMSSGFAEPFLSSFYANPSNVNSEAIGHGGGTLLYPGVANKTGRSSLPASTPEIGGIHDIPLDSIRLKLWRDSQEDREYMELLRLQGRTSEVDTIVDTLYSMSGVNPPSKYYTLKNNINDIFSARESLANLILFNQEKKYSISNFTTLISNWLKTGISSDLNVDNIVNTKDLGIMMSKWN